MPRDVVALLHQAGGRDFPRNFREKLASVLLGEPRHDGDAQKQSRWRRMSFPSMSVNASISMLAHYRHTGTSAPALADRSFRNSSEAGARTGAARGAPSRGSDEQREGRPSPIKGTPKIMKRPSAAT